jgi:hypothetical protein
VEFSSKSALLAGRFAGLLTRIVPGLLTLLLARLAGLLTLLLARLVALAALLGLALVLLVHFNLQNFRNII